MIPFFRKIRKKMADDNKPIKYLRYAIGEIVLVVIGILIALQINNWNENRQFEALKKELCLELLDELQYNIDRIHFLDSSTTLNYSFKSTDSLLRLKVLSLKGGLDTNEIVQLFQGSQYKYNAFNLNSDVYEQLKENKILNTLDKDIKFTIVSYYHQINREEIYNLQSLPRILEAYDQCKYGYQELRDAYFVDSSSYLKNHAWIFDKSSKNYIDLKNYLEVVYYNIHRNRQRMVGIIDESEKLKKLLLTNPQY